MRKQKINKQPVGDVFSGKSGVVDLTAQHPEIKRVITNDMYCTQDVYDAMLQASALGGEDTGAYPWDVATMMWATLYEHLTGKSAVDALMWLAKNKPNHVISINGVTLPLGMSALIYIFFDLRMPLDSAITRIFCASCQQDPVTGSWFWIIELMPE